MAGPLSLGPSPCEQDHAEGANKTEDTSLDDERYLLGLDAADFAGGERRRHPKSAVSEKLIQRKVPGKPSKLWVVLFAPSLHAICPSKQPAPPPRPTKRST